MDYGTTSEMHRELLLLLRDELSFYQSLYILIDRQRDLLKHDREEELAKVFAEIDRYTQRIKESEMKLRALARKHRDVLAVVAASEEIRRLVQSIAMLIEKNLETAKANEAFIAQRHAKIQDQLDELEDSHDTLKLLRGTTGKVPVKTTPSVSNRER